MRYIIHCTVYHNEQLTEFLRKVRYNGWGKLELSSIFCGRCSVLFREVFYLCAVCYTAQCFIYLSRRFREDCGTSCVTDYTV